MTNFSDQSKAAIIGFYSKLFKRHKCDNFDVKDLCNPPPEKKFEENDKQELEPETSKNKSKKDETDNREDGDDNEEENDDEELLSSSEEEDTTPSSKMIIANRFFVNETIKVKKAFEELLKEKFNEKIEKVDFNDEAAAEKVNSRAVSFYKGLRVPLMKNVQSHQ